MSRNLYRRRRNRRIRSLLVLIIVLVILVIAFLCFINIRKTHNEEELRQQGIEALDSSNYDEAVSYFEEALATQTGDYSRLEEDIMFYLANAQYLDGDSDSAIDTYTNLIDADDEDDKAYYLRGMVYLNTEDYSAALDDFDNAIAYTDENAKMTCAIADELCSAGYEDEADKYLNSLLSSKYDNNSESLYYMGYASSLLEEYDKALSYYEEGISLLEDEDEYEDDLLKGQISAYEYQGDFEKAYELMTTYLKKYPNDEEAIRENTFLESRI